LENVTKFIGIFNYFFAKFKLTISFKDGELFVPYRSLILLVRADLFSVDCFFIKLAGAVKTKIKHKLKSINRKIIILF